MCRTKSWVRRTSRREEVQLHMFVFLSWELAEVALSPSLPSLYAQGRSLWYTVVMGQGGSTAGLGAWWVYSWSGGRVGLQLVRGQGGSTAGLGAGWVYSRSGGSWEELQATVCSCLQSTVNFPVPIKYTSHYTNWTISGFLILFRVAKYGEAQWTEWGVGKGGECVGWKFCEIGQLDGRKEH